MNAPRRPEIDSRPKASTIWEGLIVVLFAGIPLIVMAVVWGQGKFNTDGLRAMMFILGVPLLGGVCLGVRWMLKGRNARVLLREDGVTGRNAWGREVRAGWAEIRRVRAYTIVNHNHDLGDRSTAYDIYHVDTVHGDICFDSSFNDHEYIDREIRLRSGTEAEGMSVLDLWFMTRSVAFLTIVIAVYVVTAIVVISIYG